MSPEGRLSGSAQTYNAAHASSFSKKLSETARAAGLAGKPSAAPSAQSMNWSAVFDQAGNRSGASPVSAAGGPGGLRHVPMPIPYRDEYTGGKKPGPEEATDTTEYHPELPPVLKIIAELRRLEKTDLPAAVALAKKHLADKIETRPQVRLASVRLAMREAGPARLEYLGGLAVSDADWFIRREAATALAADIGEDKAFKSQAGEAGTQAADNRAGLLKDALLAAAMDEVASVRLAARAALAKLGVDAPEEPLSDYEALVAYNYDAARI